MKRWTKSWPEWSLTKPEHHPSFLPTQLRIADIWLDKVRAFLINPTAGEIRLPKLVFFSQLRRSVQVFNLLAFGGACHRAGGKADIPKAPVLEPPR